MKLAMLTVLFLLVTLTSFSQVTPPNNPDTARVRINAPTVDKNGVFQTVDEEASFPGGEIVWRQFVEVNFDLRVPVNNKAPEGTYTAYVRFIVDTDGTISDLNALTSHGYGIEDEFLRIMRLSPKWNPAKVNGKHVKAYKMQPLKFTVSYKTPIPTATFPTDTISKEEASFPGGEKGYREFLQKNLNVNVPYDKKAPEGTYTVVVQFTIDTDGSVTDIMQMTIHGYGMEQEVMRLFKSSPKWNPAKVNGVPVKAIRKQPVTFVVSNE